MLKFMRKHAKFFYIFFFLVIISFIFFYVGPVDKSSDVPVAEIEDTRINIDEYWRAYDRARDFYRESYKEQFNEEMEKKLNLKEKVLDNLIDEKVLLLTARDMKITVTDDDVREAITSDPSFMRNNSFSSDVYFRMLQINRITPDYFEKMKKQELTLIKLERLISESTDTTGFNLPQLTGNEQTLDAIKQAMLQDKKKRVVKSFVEGMKKNMKIKVNSKLIA